MGANIEDFVADNSNFVKLVTYNRDTLEMSITSKSGEVYTCVKVPHYLFIAFKEAKSKGKFFNNNIKNKFKHHYFK